MPAMRKVLLVLLLSLGTLHSTAQEYHPFMTGIDSVTFNRIWCFEACCPVTFTIRPVDTVYRDSTWRPVYREGSGFTEQLMGWFQEDTAARKVYCHSLVGTMDTIPFLLYDFSMNEGDTIRGFRPWVHGGLDTLGKIRLDSIRTISTLAGPRKVFYLKEIAGWGALRIRWIEGVGMPEEDFFYEGADGSDLMNCRFDNETQVYKYPYVGGYPEFNLSCTPECFGKVPKMDYKQLVQVAPNPVTDKCTLTLKDATDELRRLTVVNGIGQVLLQKTVQGSKVDWNLSQLPRGYYLLLIETKKGKITVPVVR